MSYIDDKCDSANTARDKIQDERTRNRQKRVTPHLSAEIVALAGTNKIVIGTVKRSIYPGHYASPGVSFNRRCNPRGPIPTASKALGGLGGIGGVSADGQ